MQFRNILGNGDLKSRLVRMVDSGRTGQSVMFVEKDGYGALPMAVALVQYMMCRNRKEGEDSCGECPACRKVSAMLHPDVHFAFPVNVSKKSGSSGKPVSSGFMQEWRELYLSNPYFTEADLYGKLEMEDKVGVIGVAEAREILDSLSLKSYEGHGKYMIVWLPERMNAEAANRLLKIVEEPSPDTCFIFITHNPDRVLPTVRSRSRMIRLSPVENGALAGFLAGKTGLGAEEAAVYARISGGSPGAALKMAGDSSASSFYLPLVCRIMDNVAGKDLPSLLESVDALVALGREKQKEFCTYAEDFLRKVMMRRIGAVSIADALPSEIPAADRYAGIFGRNFFEKAFRAFEDARSAVESNVNPKMVFCNLNNQLYVLYNAGL